MDPALMAALQASGGPPGAPPMGPDPNALPPGPGGAPMPMMAPPPMGGTPADAAMPILMAIQAKQAQDQAQFEQTQQAEVLSAMAAAVGQLPNPLGAAAASQGALPPPPDALGAAPTDPSLDPNAMAMSGG